MSKPKIEIPQEFLDLYDKLISANTNIERKGKTVPYTSLNGHMFSFLAKDGTMGLRLPKEERGKFIKKYKTQLSVQYGSVMKEYVDIPHELFLKPKTLSKYLQLSYDYIKTLKPKPTKKKK